MFVQENIEKLKHQWTDKYVVVTQDRPELRRFDGYTGQVKTVNMNGRALVEFDAWNNIGWYDIELDYLKQVPKPDPEMAGKRAEPVKVASAGGQSKSAAAEGTAAPKPAAAKPGGKMSVADILAAARANKTAGDAPASPAAKVAPKAKEAPAAAVKPAKQAATASEGVELPKGQRPTVAQMLAYCRQHDAQA